MVYRKVDKSLDLKCNTSGGTELTFRKLKDKMPGPPSPSTEVLDWLLELGLESYSSWFLRTSSTNTMDGLVVLAKSGSKVLIGFPLFF